MRKTIGQKIAGMILGILGIWLLLASHIGYKAPNYTFEQLVKMRYAKPTDDSLVAKKRVQNSIDFAMSGAGY